MATVTQTKTKTTTTTTTIKPKQKYTFHKPDSSHGKTHKYLRINEDLKPLVKDSSDSEEEPFFHRGNYVSARYGHLNKNKANSDTSYTIDDLSDDEDLELIMPIQKARAYQLCCACNCSIL